MLNVTLKEDSITDGVSIPTPGQGEPMTLELIGLRSAHAECNIQTVKEDSITDENTQGQHNAVINEYNL